MSLLFYSWGETKNVILLFILGVINYYGGNRIYQTKSIFLFVGFVVFNLAILIYFKYLAWILGLVTGVGISVGGLPLGISFFVFHAISYLIDIWRGNILPANSSQKFLTYFFMFPHLVAGPIVRYAQIKDSLTHRCFNKELFNYGIYRFLAGLNKKVLIANNVSLLADTAFAFSTSGNLYFFDAWFGIVAYAIQIYFDFSGYSDMAIGLAAMAGFKFEENFNRPYSSKSVSDFWRRWHISLSTWLRDYVYIPLGGSRNGNLYTYRNQLFVFLLCGIWHGANVTFIVWGLWHGIFLVIEKIKMSNWLERCPYVLSRLYTFIVVIIGWVFFRSNTIDEACKYIQVMFNPSFDKMYLGYYSMELIAMFTGVFLCVIPDKVVKLPSTTEFTSFSLNSYFLQAILAIVSISMLIASGRNPFIYFNF